MGGGLVVESREWRAENEAAWYSLLSTLCSLPITLYSLSTLHPQPATLYPPTRLT
jgi:hypothetical protein